MPFCRKGKRWHGGKGKRISRQERKEGLELLTVDCPAVVKVQAVEGQLQPHLVQLAPLQSRRQELVKVELLAGVVDVHAGEQRSDVRCSSEDGHGDNNKTNNGITPEEAVESEARAGPASEAQRADRDRKKFAPEKQSGIQGGMRDTGIQMYRQNALHTGNLSKPFGVGPRELGKLTRYETRGTWDTRRHEEASGDTRGVRRRRQFNTREGLLKDMT